MKHITDIKDYRSDRGTVVTIGKFDGVHRGHRKIPARVHELARNRGLLSAVFTFTVSPQVQMGERRANMLMTNRERAVYLRERDVDILVECPFTEEIRTMEAGDFVKDILVDRLGAKAVVVGTDARFGKDRKGTPEFLLACADACGFTVEVIEKEKDGDRDISSTFIREELALGHMERVRELLGYPYFVSGPIVHRRHLGHSLGFPTINQVPEPEKMLPPHGVYMSRTLVGGRLYQGISNIGVKPTVNGDKLGLETYLFDCSLDLYGQEARVEILHFRRPERRFASVEALRQHLETDIRAADDYFSV